MSQESLLEVHESKSETEKALAHLKSIDDNLCCLYNKVHDIDDKLLHSQSVAEIKKIHNTLVALGGYIVFFGVVTIILLYRMD